MLYRRTDLRWGNYGTVIWCCVLGGWGEAKWKTKLPDSVYAEWTAKYIQSNSKNYSYLDYYQQPVEEAAKAFAALSQDDD